MSDTIFVEHQTTREFRRADFKEDGLWHLTAGRDAVADGIAVIYEVAYAPRKTREEAQAWVDEVLRSPESNNPWVTRTSGLVVPRGTP